MHTSQRPARRLLTRTLISAAIVASGLAIGGVGTAVASTGSTPETVALAAFPAGHTVAANPAAKITCQAQIQNPHNSSHVHGTVNVVTTVKCTAPVADIKLTVRLYRNGRQVASRDFNRAGSAWLKGNAAHACSSGNYQGRALITIVFPPGFNPPGGSGAVASHTVAIHC